MNTADIAVIAGAVTASLGLLWFFFGSRTAAHVAERHDDVQKVTVVLSGGYDPQRIQAVAGIPLQIDFDRRESGDCTSRVVFPELGISRSLPAYEHTTVQFVPQQVGEFGFSCAMNMIHGTLTVLPGDAGSALLDVEQGDPVDVAATEAQGNLALVAVFQKTLDVAHLDVVVAIVGAGTEFNFLDLDHFLL